MSNWFGNLQLAYKYVVVFLSLLALTMLAGFVKVFYNRQKLKKAKSMELEAGPKEDAVELNQREKDEGDLFGIRAIEAGFYAGVAQSRPTSRAGSIMGNHPSMSTSTLVGGNVNSPLMKGMSNNNSVLSLNLNATNNATQPASRPAMKLRPSEAELSGRRNHNGSVDMALQVPPSPGHPRGPTYEDSDVDSDGFTSPRSMSPNPQHYAPVPKTKVSVHEADKSAPKSRIASFNNSPAVSPTAPALRNPPTARLPTIPGSATKKESRSPSPDYNYPSVRVHQPNNEPAQDSPTVPQIQLQPRVYSPSHERDGSDVSSISSSGNRLSTFQAYQAYQKQADRDRSALAVSGESRGLSSTDGPGRTSILAVSSDNDAEHRPKSTNLLAPGPGGKDARLSEFYEAYYRNSTLGPAQPVEPKKQTNPYRQSTIMEADTPMALPMFPKSQ